MAKGSIKEARPKSAIAVCVLTPPKETANKVVYDSGDEDEDERPQPVVVTTNGPIPTDTASLLHRVPELVKAPNSKLTAGDASRWINQLGNNLSVSSSHSDYAEMRWLHIVIGVNSIWEPCTKQPSPVSPTRLGGGASLNRE